MSDYGSSRGFDRALIITACAIMLAILLVGIALGRLSKSYEIVIEMQSKAPAQSAN